MPADQQQAFEERLTEFTEVHGTVLLGMHRELQSQLKKTDATLEAAERRLLQLAEHTRDALAKQVETTRFETEALVDTAQREANNRLQSANRTFGESFANFSRRLENSETKVLAYTIKQQHLLDAQAVEIRTVHGETQRLLAEAGQKIAAHQHREAAFDRKLRQLLVGLAIATSIVVALGIWKPWIN